MNEKNLKQMPIKSQKLEAKQPSAKRFRIIWAVIKLVIIIAFFIGAYYLLDKIGIIEKVKDGFFLLQEI